MTAGGVRRILLCGALLLALGGCVTTQGVMPKKTDGAWAQRRDALLELPEWQLEGRIALSAGKDGWSGTFSWRQVYDDLDFRFRGPLGIGGFRIHGDNDRLRVKTTAGDEFYMSDPERDLRERYGWSIPVQSMRYWMLGVPDPQAPAAETLETSAPQLALLQQRGWTVEYTGYQDTDGTSLPRKVTIEGEGIRIRVIVERWQLGE